MPLARETTARAAARRARGSAQIAIANTAGVSGGLPTAHGGNAARAHGRTFGALQRALTITAFTAVPASVLILLIRRLSGAASAPLPAGVLLFTGLLLVAWAASVHLQRNVFNVSERRWNVVRWLPAIVLVAAVAAILVAGTTAWAGTSLVLLMAAEEAIAWKLRSRRDQPSTGSSVPDARRVAVAPVQPAERMTAQITRGIEPDGTHVLTGWLEAEFSAGQRTSLAHVAFCPALAGQLMCDAEQTAGPPATIRVSQLLPYGARFEIKLDTPARAPARVTFDFSARSAPSTLAN